MGLRSTGLHIKEEGTKGLRTPMDGRINILESKAVHYSSTHGPWLWKYFNLFLFNYFPLSRLKFMFLLLRYKNVVSSYWQLYVSEPKNILDLNLVTNLTCDWRQRTCCDPSWLVTKVQTDQWGKLVLASTFPYFNMNKSRFTEVQFQYKSWRL